MTIAKAQKAVKCSTCLGTGVQSFAGSKHAGARLCPVCFDPCGTCQGLGEVVRRDEQGYRLVQQCPECGPARHRALLFAKSRVPPRYHGCRLGTYRAMEANQGDVRSFMVNYLQNFKKDPRGVLLMGDPGVGKTHLLVATIRAMTLMYGLPCTFVEFSQLLTEIKVGYQSGQTEEQIIAPLVRVPILAIDDMGKGVGSEWEMVILDALISRRYNAKRPVLVTTNYYLKDPLNALQTPSKRRTKRVEEPEPIAAGRTRRERVRAARARLAESLEERVGARVASRLGEMCYAQEIEGSDFRKKGLI